MRLSWMTRRRAALLLVLCSGLVACSDPETPSFTETVRDAAVEDARTGPGLWRLRDDDTTVYLFGTVHTLRPETRWETDAIIEAFSEADAVYFEADVESSRAQQALNQTVTELGFYLDGGSLEDTLDPRDEAEVEETARLLGKDLESLSHMKPWFASFDLSRAHQDRQGFDPNAGVERVLSERARRARKPLRYLETGADQIRIIGTLPEKAQIDLLVQTAEQIESEPDFLDRLIGEWAEGDAETLGDLIADDEAFGSGVVYERLLKNRNANWTEQIGDLMAEEAGTFFIAVGAAHLAGEDSVQDMLDAKGFVVARVNPRKQVPD